MTAWLIAPSALEALHEARQRPIDPEAAKRLEALARPGRRGDTPAGYRVDDGGTAVVTVEGPLTRTPDPLLGWLMGATTAYVDIGEALDLAERDPAVQRVRLEVDSPGGEVDGLHELMERLAAYPLPIEVLARNALSAAYGIAAAAGPITATSAASMLGSVGVAVSYWTSDRIVDVTDRDAPRKRPDVRTPEGRAAVQDYLDEIAALFRRGIARGRGVSVEHVAQQYGRGGVLLAERALALGMIDSIAGHGGRRSTTTSTRATRAQEIEMSMTTDRLRAEHPELVREIEEAAAARERARVVGHLDLGTRSGARELAEAAIRDGAPVDAAATTAHMDALTNRRDRSARQQETDAVGAIVDGAPAVGVDSGDLSSPAMASAVAARIAARRGMTQHQEE